MKKTFDVYAYGMIAASTLHVLSMPFPAPDGYSEIRESLRMTGGEAANASIVLSRLGVTVKLDGTWIGDTAEGQALLETLRSFNLEISRLHVEAGYPGVREIVFSDDETRSVFGSYATLLAPGAPVRWNMPCREDVAAAALACIDPFFGPASELAAQYALDEGVPYVTVDCPHTGSLAQNAAAVIVSGEYRRRDCPGEDLMVLFNAYQKSCRGLVIFTGGGEGGWYARPGEPSRQFSSYPVQVVDTAGAGDSFRSGVMYGLLKGWPDTETVNYAAALAALVCASFPGVLNSPSHEQILDLVKTKPK
ncbi:MAG: carbohydrate kinase family protein [Chloroflexota bacterium]